MSNPLALMQGRFLSKHQGRYHALEKVNKILKRNSKPSDLNTYITGQNIIVDGGFTLV